MGHPFTSQLGNRNSQMLLYTNTCDMWNKQEEWEICVQSQGLDLMGTMETWWDSSHDWNVVMKG